MTTATRTQTTVTMLDRDKWNFDPDQGLCIAAVGFTDGQIHDEAAELAWERTVDEVIEEISPVIGDLLYRALERRLPWTWESER